MGDKVAESYPTIAISKSHSVIDYYRFWWVIGKKQSSNSIIYTTESRKDVNFEDMQRSESKKIKSCLQLNTRDNGRISNSWIRTAEHTLGQGP